MLQTGKRYDETGAMASRERGETTLSTAELQSLVQQLRQQLAEKDTQIAELKRRLGQSVSAEADLPVEEADSVSENEAAPGSQEDLFAQLDKMYQDR